MTKRLCRCGAITERQLCTKCQPAPSQLGYDYAWEKFSDRQRQLRPLCQVCDARGIATPAAHLHHIEKIRDSPGKRLDVDNTLAVCIPCHKEVEPMDRLTLVTFLEKLEHDNQ